MPKMPRWGPATRSALCIDRQTRSNLHRRTSRAVDNERPPHPRDEDRGVSPPCGARHAVPMRTLLRLRHAKSSWADPTLPDHDRPLAPRGPRAAQRMATHLLSEGER
jgi:hypothetical protein